MKTTADNHEGRESPQPEIADARRPYAAPQVTKFGGVDQITQNVGRRGRQDSHGRHGGGRQRRTGF